MTIGSISASALFSITLLGMGSVPPAISRQAENMGVMTTADETYKAMREIHAARLAIFNGSPDEATAFIGAAQADMEAVGGRLREDAYIPFDTSLALAKDFEPTAEKQASIEEANRDIARGAREQAVAVLKAAKIGVTVSAALIPVFASLQHVKDAAALLGQKKYYEANLALKAVEDSVVFNTHSANGE